MRILNKEKKKICTKNVNTINRKIKYMRENSRRLNTTEEDSPQLINLRYKKHIIHK